ncbi:MAG: hypothetical protein R2795_22190 [Saprospiraceae bacterium]
MKHFGWLLFFFILAWYQVGAQLSPGDLSRAHASLEGMTNCTQCHVLGDKVSNEKCLACHDEINDLLKAKTGYHYAKDVRGKDCATCHSDHHGRNFDMVRFDEDNFNHRLTGYELKGSHKTADCRACHQPDFITDRDLKKRQDTWLGLHGTSCKDCHEDVHRQTLGNDCAKCHTTEAFQPASLFNHDKTDFPLVGQHKSVDCKDCHQTEWRDGKEFQRFTDIPFSNCIDCHDDPHRNQLGNQCNACHTEQSFTAQSNLRRFNHNATGFPLRHKHRSVDCFACHQDTGAPLTVFQDRAGITVNACATCHDDVHEGRFGTTCADCHTEEGWRGHLNTDRFNHNLTDFALLGKHQTVDCKQCHIADSFTEPLAPNACAACHQDYHEGELANVGGNSPDCAQCHTVDGFAPAGFTIDDHSASAFPLTGGHLATPCFDCHLQDDGRWHFKNIGTRCVDCHQDVHLNEISARYYPEQECATCHTTSSWNKDHTFNHSLTAFPLEGKHATTDCIACHKKDEEKPQGRFANLQTECVACHENVHGEQFIQNGHTDCTRCHGFEGWSAIFFDHNETQFPLTGKHAEIVCSACHLPIVDANGMEQVVYKIERFECRDCHQ